MYELILGFILAAIFVASYLLISKLFSEEKPELTGKTNSISLTPANTDRAIEGLHTRGALPEHIEKQDKDETYKSFQ